MKEDIKSFSFSMTALLGLFGICIFLCIVLAKTDVLCSFLSLQTLWILAGGAFVPLLVAFPVSQIVRAFREVLKSLFVSPLKEKDMAKAIMHASEITYTSTLLALQKNYLSQYTSYEFWLTGLKLLLDGSSTEQCRKLMQKRMTSLYNNQMSYVAILDMLAKDFFVFGLLCAILFLMVGGIATLSLVLLPVSYGVILSFFIVKPLSIHLKQNARQILANSSLCLIGFEAVDSSQNPRKTQAELNAVLPPEQQINYFEG